MAFLLPFLLFLTAGPEQPPRALNRGEWLRSEDYPHEAIRRGEQGAVAVRLTINPQGRVRQCDVTSSSGSEALDAKTCDVITARARFEPARDAAGHAVEGEIGTRVLWNSGTGAIRSIEPWGMVNRIALSGAGEVLSCTSRWRGWVPSAAADFCDKVRNFPPEARLAMRAGAGAESVEVIAEYDMHIDGMERVPPHYLQRAVTGISTVQFDINRRGHVENCTPTRQLGSPLLLVPLCGTPLISDFRGDERSYRATLNLAFSIERSVAPQE